MITKNIPIDCQAEKIFINTYETLRIKITDKCPFTCNFCHREGSAKSDEIHIGKVFTKFIKRFIHEIGISEIHLTGGEPTTYPEIVKLVELLSNLNLKVKVTSNGQFSKDLLDNLKEAGLASLNISLHTLDPEKLASIMSPVRDKNWGKKALKYQLTNLIYAKELGIETKINTVAHSFYDITKIISFCKNNQIELRILDDLNQRSLSLLKINESLKSIGATIKGINLTEKSSSFSYIIVSNDSFEFKVKSIRKNILETLCNDCLIRDTCKEWFYGIRLEQIDEELIVRLCLHRQDYPAKQNVEDFFSSDQFIEISNNQIQGDSCG